MTPLKNPKKWRKHLSSTFLIARFHEHKYPFSRAQVPVFTSTSARFHGHKYPFSRAQAFDTIQKFVIMKDVEQI